MDFNLIVFEGTDKIKFGMSSEEVQAVLNMKPTFFKKTEFDIFDTEEYEGICHVYYEVGDMGVLKCAAIEFFEPAQVYLENIQLLGEGKEKIQALFNVKFYDCLSDASGASSKKFDIAFYSDDKTVQSVFIARKGYSAEQEEFYGKKYAEKYAVSEILDDITVRMRLCPSCMEITNAKEGAVCPKCNVPLI